jgi:hypothetical protein
MSKNRNHLAPTVIVNKNGVRTTVHKKPATETTSSNKLPNVTLPTSDKTRTELEQEAALLLVNPNSRYPKSETELERWDKNYKKLLTVLHPYSDETLQRLTTAATTDAGSDLTEFICRGAADEEYINDWIAVEPFASQEGIDSVPVLHGLQKYENLTPQKDGHYPARRTEEVFAITRVTAHFEDLGHGIDYGVNPEDYNMQYIEDEKLRDLLTTHENPRAVADLIVQRDITDADQIRSLLAAMETTANAITSGTL